MHNYLFFNPFIIFQFSASRITRSEPMNITKKRSTLHNISPSPAEIAALKKRITSLEQERNVLLARVETSEAGFQQLAGKDTAIHNLRESEEAVRRKLESILSPGSDLGRLDLVDIIDVQAIRSLMEDFYKLTHIPMAIVDLKGKVLVGVGWQKICVEFHRPHPEACKHCIESDTQLSAGVLQGEFKLYKCKNNMWDIVSPFIVGGQHVGNIFSGQFFFDSEPLDYELFRSQARKFGFDEKKYIAALEAVPRLSKETVNTSMTFFTKFAHLLSQSSHNNIKLARSLNQLRNLAAVVESSNDFIGMCTPDMKPFFVNEAGREMVGLDSMAEVLQTQMMDFFWPDDRRLIELQGVPSLQKEGRWSGEVRFRHFKTGEPIYTWWNAFVIRDEAGNPAAWATISPNLNNIKSLEAAQTAAVEASRAKSEFLAKMSHEIRTPMTIFMAATEHLLELETIPERREVLELAGQSAQRLHSLIDDILDFSRIEAGRVSVQDEPFNLRSCMRDTVALMTIAARRKKLRLEIVVAPEVPHVISGDSDRLGQVLINLIGNAVKFTEKGEVKVSVERREQALHFAVADTGIGIPEGKRSLLFQSFSQVESSLTRKYGGTGLGLAICKGLVELMGGKITVDSREGGGSIFAFSLPLKTPH
jgi:PAS domain S-box-containing protein